MNTKLTNSEKVFFEMWQYVFATAFVFFSSFVSFLWSLGKEPWVILFWFLGFIAFLIHLHKWEHKKETISCMASQIRENAEFVEDVLEDYRHKIKAKEIKTPAMPHGLSAISKIINEAKTIEEVLQ